MLENYNVEKCGGSKERTSKNKKINRISVEVGDRVTIMVSIKADNRGCFCYFKERFSKA